MSQIRDILLQKSAQFVDVSSKALSNPAIKGNKSMTLWIRALAYILSGNACGSLLELGVSSWIDF